MSEVSIIARNIIKILIRSPNFRIHKSSLLQQLFCQVDNENFSKAIDALKRVKLIHENQYSGEISLTEKSIETFTFLLSSEKTRGQIAYEGYCKNRLSTIITATDNSPTQWLNLPEGVKEAWEAAGEAVANDILDNRDWNEKD